MSSNTIVSKWLIAIMILISVIIVIGAITRLTSSGLSMPFWDLVEIVPPLSEESWLDKFEEYKKTLDYKNQSISSISEFKTIFWWEYIHRIIGRIIGLVALIPLLVFIYKGYLTPKQKRSYGVILFLIITQGVVGWLMVKSGLSEGVYNQSKGVSPFWLLLHLGLAFLTFCYTLFNYLKLNHESIINKSKFNINPGVIIFLLIFIQILLGALMSGFKAAHLYPSFPLMNGEFYPSKMEVFKFSNIEFINFSHRWFAFIALSMIGGIYLKIKRSISLKQKAIFLTLCYAVILQVFLGILSLLNPVIPFAGEIDQITIAVMHQFVAIVLLAICTTLTFSFSNR